MTILVTGAAGFIGMHVGELLLARGEDVWGVDNLNEYYDVTLKRARLARLTGHPTFRFTQIDISDRASIGRLFAEHKPDRVIHLAAQAGVRYSLENPYAYADSNFSGFLTILEACRQSGVRHLVYASSSSVYGGNAKMPFSEHDSVNHPVSLYAASKKANELMAHAYSHLFGLPTTGLRFFTVYGPWGRPDMALFLFTKAILEDRPINVFNLGRMRRDFTYIDDIARCVCGVLDHVPEPSTGFDPSDPDPATSWAPYRVMNVGNHSPVELMTYIATLERALGKTARKEFLPMQNGDVPATYADVDLLHATIGTAPATPVETGIQRFVEWYRSYYKA